MAAIVLCTHHKGGVGKSELAIHLAGIAHKLPKRTLLIDCDPQPSAWSFHDPGGQRPTRELDRLQIDAYLTVLWNPGRVRLEKQVDLDRYDYCVLDVDSPLENTVQTIVQNQPGRIYIPVNLQPEALTRLEDPLKVIHHLQLADHPMRVTIVPLGSKIADIKTEINRLDLPGQSYKIAAKIRNLEREANRARRERKYIWEYPECQDLEGYYQRLLES